jgi:hypothetical protein
MQIKAMVRRIQDDRPAIVENDRNMAQPKQTKPAPLSAEEIREIVGRLSDDRIAAIQATKATAAEVVEAFTWLSSDEYAGGRHQPPVTGVVAEVYDILKPELPEVENEHPRPA